MKVDKIISPPSITPNKIISLFNDLGCTLNEKTKDELFNFPRADEVLYLFFKTGQMLSEVERNTVLSTLLFGLESEDIFNRYLAKYISDNFKTSSTKISKLLSQSGLSILFLDTLFLLDETELNHSNYKLRQYLLPENSDRYNSMDSTLESLAYLCCDEKYTPTQAIKNFRLMLTEKTRVIIAKKINTIFFNIYCDELNGNLKLQKDVWYLKHFIVVEENGIANPEVVQRLEKILKLCSSSNEFELIIPLITDIIRKLLGTSRIDIVFPNISEEAIKIIKQFNKETQYQIFYNIAKVLYEHDEEISYSENTGGLSDKNRLNSRVIQWMNYLNQIDEIYIFIPREGINKLKDWIERDIDYDLSDQIINQIKTINIDSELVIIKIGNIVLMERFRGHGGKSPTLVYSDLPDSFFDSIKNINKFNEHEIQKFSEYKKYEIKHFFLWQTEATKLLNEKFNIKTDNETILKTVNIENNDFSATIPRSYRDSLYYLEQEKRRIPGGTNIKIL